MISRFGVVYKITCKISNKSYIGATTNSINIRWNAHTSCARRKKSGAIIFHSAINKYGTENFTINS